MRAPHQNVEQSPGKDDTQWAISFREKHGRRPRVLHIGNIANNGYLNAKILERAGFDCDVLCYDYYHIMGCPEWEDADFQGELDPFAPDWRSLELNDFRRPRWFAQGPQTLCLRYLMARRRGKKRRAAVLWFRLEARRWARNNRRLRRLAGRFPRWPARSVKIARRLPHLIRAQGVRTLRAPRALARKALEKLPSNRVRSMLKKLLQGLVRQKAKAISTKILKKRSRRTGDVPADGPPPGPRPVSDPLERWTLVFSRHFPDREDELSTTDLDPYRGSSPLWAELLSEYDLVVGYATDGLIPLLSGKHPYLAYEHGTIRSIPFEATPQGRLCALTYREADRAMITNCDNIVAAERLGLREPRFIPHPVNEDPVPEERGELLRQEIQNRADSDFILFHPARHHWEGCRHPDWEKGNDILIQGLAPFIHEVAPKACAVFVDWGQTTGASRALLRDLGIDDRILWIPPQCHRWMVSYIQASDAVADQFYLGAFGSTMPKAMLHGSPVLIYIDERRHEWCFPEMPPVINSRTPLDVFRGLKKLYCEPSYRDSIIRSAREWYRRYHSSEVIAGVFSEVFARATSTKTAGM